jgi:two-component system, LytTR family, sensor kinase
MLIGILIKTIFSAVVWFMVLPSFRRNGQLALMLIKLLLLMFACMMIEVGLSWQFETFHLSHMVSHQSSVIWVNLAVYLGITMIMLAIVFTRQWIENERKQRELIEANLITELAFLKSQINPHFLFNTLNNIFSIAQRDKNEEVAMSISRLSGLMRYVLDEGRNSFVPLKKEVDHLRDFIGLASMRYASHEVEVKFSATGDLENTVIAPMILLPFVENAFKHGVRIGEHSSIIIEINATENKIRFSSRNPLKRTQQTTNESTGVGLVNVKRRIELLYPGKNKLEIDDSGSVYSVNLLLE